MRNSKRLAVVLVLLVMGIAGCEDSDYRKAVRATASISVGMAALQDANETAFKAGMLDQDEAREIALGIADATRANDELIKQLRQVKSLNGSKQQVAVLVHGVVASIDNLNQNGVLRIKNEKARVSLSAALKGASIASQILVQLLEGK